MQQLRMATTFDSRQRSERTSVHKYNMCVRSFTIG